MKKHAANILSLSRVVMALTLFLAYKNKFAYLAIYIICWLTDALDGAVARATKSQSELGSKLDDLGDTVLIVSMGIIMILWMKTEAIRFIPLIVMLILLRIANMFYTRYKFGQVCIIHTYGAKLLGILVLLLPIVYIIFNSLIMLYIVLAFSIMVTLEEALIHITSKDYNPERKSVFMSRVMEINNEKSIPAQ